MLATDVSALGQSHQWSVMGRAKQSWAGLALFESTDAFLSVREVQARGKEDSSHEHAV